MTNSTATATATATTATALTLNQIKAKLDIKDHNYGRITHGTAQLGKWEVTTSQWIDEDRNCYSKKWHRMFGAKYTVSKRAITFKCKHGKGFITKTVELNSWAGNYLEKAIVAAGIAPKKPKTPLSVRLNKAYDATLIKTLRGHRIYQRTLLGVPVDYVIVAPMGTTFHSDKYSDLIRGLYTKIRAAANNVKFSETAVDWNACKKLGFCNEGIKEFCKAFDLNYNGKYSVDQIAAKVRKNLKLAAPFYAELKTLAAAYNYSINV
ncbi:MAG: hypothetical protein ACRDCT_10440 [Shewanella sp.]|uniref:hypothetical protein n=1 Tax=Shewanella sp. TaxID=50422 RepID=UPI003F3925E0